MTCVCASLAQGKTVICVAFLSSHCPPTGTLSRWSTLRTKSLNRLFVWIITGRRVQFGKNLHECGFLISIKIWAFCKTHDCKLVSNWTCIYYLIIYITKLQSKFRCEHRQNSAGKINNFKLCASRHQNKRFD